MNTKHLIDRCKERNANPLRDTGRRSILHAKPDDYILSYHPEVFYAHKRSVVATEFADSGIGIIPIGHAGHPYVQYGDYGWRTTFTAHHWEQRYWRDSWGIQVYTGRPSGFWLDLDFEYESVALFPDETAECIERLITLTGSPLLTITKSGGLRFSCRTPGYVHPRTKEMQEYVYRFSGYNDDGNMVRDLLLEVISDRNLSRFDARYEIVLGDIMSPPEIPIETLMEAVEQYRRQLHKPEPPQPKKLKQKSAVPTAQRERSSHHIKVDYNVVVEHLTDPSDWVRRKDGTIKSKRGNFPCNMTFHKKKDRKVQFYMKRNGEVRAFCHDCKRHEIVIPGQTETQMVAELIAKAPEPEQIPTKEQQRQWLIERIRRGEASPLELKRAKPNAYSGKKITEFGDYAENAQKIREAFDNDARVVLVISETGAGKNYQMEEFVLSGGKITKTTPTKELGLADEDRFVNRQIIGQFWRTRFWKWDEQCKRSQEDLLVYPFINGAMCIDAERCEWLNNRGGNPRHSICPNCEVFETCKREGYLSQISVLQVSDAQVLAIPDLFLNPDMQSFAKTLLEPVEVFVPGGDDDEDNAVKVHRVGVTDEAKAYDLFQECRLLKSQLEAWRDMWGNRPLGEFAKTMLEILEVERKDKRTRVLRFYINDLHEELIEDISNQMKHILAWGDVVDEGFEDLAVISMKFNDRATVPIAKDWDAYKEMWERDIPCLKPFEYKQHDAVEITIEQAIRFGIYFIDSFENIEEIPKVERSFTPIKQLQRLLEHYPHNENVPMYYDGWALVFAVPPVLHPHLNRFVAMSATLNPEHAKRAFPDIEKIAVVQTPPTKLKDGARIYQIRTGAYPRSSLINFDKEGKNYKAIDMKPRCKQFFDYIERQISTANYNHAVITFKKICEWVASDWMDTYGALKFFDHFDNMEGLSDVFDDVDVLWIVGTPELRIDVIMHRARIIYGTDEKPMYPQRSDDRMFFDDRVQSVYESLVVAKLQQAVGRLRLNLHPKRVFIFSNVFIPSVSDRKETVAFDFEDCEVSSSIDDLDEVILVREEAEKNSDSIDDDILARILAGDKPFSLVGKGYPEYAVRKVVRDNPKAVEEGKHVREQNEKVEIQRIYDNNNRSLNATAGIVGKSTRTIKKILGL